MENFFIVAETQANAISASISSIAAIIAAVIAGIVAIAGYILTSRNNTKLSFINTATASRIKWISEVRELISDFITLLPQYNPFILSKIKNNNWGFTNQYLNFNKLLKIKTKLILLLGCRNKGSNGDEKDSIVLNDVEATFKTVEQLNIFFTAYACSKSEEIDSLLKELDDDFCNTILENLDGRIFQDVYFNNKTHKDKIAYFLSSKKTNTDNYYKYIYIVDINSAIKDIINNQLASQIKKIICSSQILLKFEWERVKAESKKGDLKKKKDL